MDERRGEEESSSKVPVQMRSEEFERICRITQCSWK